MPETIKHWTDVCELMDVLMLGISVPVCGVEMREWKGHGKWQKSVFRQLHDIIGLHD